MVKWQADVKSFQKIDIQCEVVSALFKSTVKKVILVTLITLIGYKPVHR